MAQRSGEDWRGVRLALSTADLLFDARLPELPSLRFGRAQPPAKKGYRAAPPGLDRMFEGHDRALPPATLALERATNPFLRCGEPAVVAAAQAHGAVDLSLVPVFAAIRGWRNSF